MAGPPLANSHASPRPSSVPYSHPQSLYSSGPPSAQFSSTPAQSPPPSSHTQTRPLPATLASSSSTPGDSQPSSSSAQSSKPSSNSPQAGTGPTNDDIEAVIQMAMASSNSSRVTNPPRDTRTQLYVGNLPYRVRWQDLKDLFRRAGTVLRADVSLGPDNRSRGYGTVLLATAEDAGRAVDMFNGYTWQTRTLEVRPDRMGEDIPLGVQGYAVGAPPLGVGGVGVALGALGGTGALGGVSMFGTSLVGNLSPVPGPLSGTGTPAGGSALASPAPTVPRFPGLSSFGAGVGLGEEDSSSRPGTGTQTSRNLFVGNLPFHIQWQDLKDLFRQAGAVQRADVALGADGRSRGFGTVSFSNEADAERAVRMFNGYEYNGRPLKVHFDKFAPPASSSAPLVGPTAAGSSTPLSPASFAFSVQTHPSLSNPYGQSQHPSLSRASLLAQQLLQSQLDHGRGQVPSFIGSRRSSGLNSYGSYEYDHEYDESAAASTGASTSARAGAQDENSLSAQLAQKLSLASPSLSQAPAQTLQQPQQHTYARQVPSHIPIPPAIQSPYTFEFLQSGPTTPYDVYDLHTYQRLNSAVGYSGMGLEAYQAQQQAQEQAYAQAQAQQQQQQQGEFVLGSGVGASLARNSVTPPSATSMQQSQYTTPPENYLPTQSRASPSSQSKSQPQTHPQSLSSSQQAPQATSPGSSSSRSHATPQQQHHHPAHPGPIALPPPPPVTAFPVPAPHTMSPQYALPPHMMSPMHHPMMGMPMMTPHGLPPITPSMPSFTFLPQPSPGLPSPAAVEPDRPPMHPHHLQHVMAPYTPFSPGVTMSPGAFWGRPGSGANPLINPAVGAPVRSGYYPYAQAQQQQQQAYLQQAQQQQQQAHEQEGRPPDGYFPPVPVSMAMAQGTGGVAVEEPAGYFPWVPPASSSQTQEQRTSGLAHEILRDDSGSFRAGIGMPSYANGDGRGHGGGVIRHSPSESEGTTAATSTSGGHPTSSRGTSWHTDDSDLAAKAYGAHITAQAGAEDVAVEDAVGDSPPHEANGANGKPRAYSADENGAHGSAGAGRVAMARADSDPVKKALKEAA